jgi:AcrR family transcriptional regulator
MSWRKEDSRAERGYHHGNLKEALLQAALDLIAKKGPAGFTFADAARLAGVSPAAPYRHFRDRDELMSSIAQRGFEQFESMLSAAWDDGRPDTVTAFERVGKAYLAFARGEPAFYSAMFESGLAVDLSPALLAASERAFAVIRAAAERLAALAPPGQPRPPAMMMALHIWSMSHGVASLFARGDAARRKLPMSAEDLLEAEVLIYLRGLGFPADRRPAAGPAEPKPGDVKPSTPPPVPPAGPPAGPWGTPK